MNWYSYCDGNPVMFCDPWGLKASYLYDEDYINNYLLDDEGNIDPDVLADMYEHASGPEDFSPEAWEIIMDLGYDGVFIALSEAILDITEELDAALAAILEEIEQFLQDLRETVWKDYFDDFGDLRTIALLQLAATISWFISKVDHGKPWDIKLLKMWLLTIKAPFPGENVEVWYNGKLYTPEELGNYTYGYIGAALNFPLELLFGGSMFAAGFPTEADKLANEFTDWVSVAEGFFAYSNRR